MSNTTSTFLHGGNVHANGIRQHYLRYGGAEGERAQRDAVILIPGITSPAVTWGFVAEHLGRQFDTYVLDARRGLSSSGPGLDYGLDTQAADVAAFAQALGLSRWALMGHSMGGRIAVRARAASRPVSRAWSSSIRRSPAPAAAPTRPPCPGMSIPSARPHWAWMPRPCAPSAPPGPRSSASCAQWLHTCHEPAIVQSFEDFGRDDIHADLPHIRHPLLLVTAERGDVVRAEDVDEWQGLAPQTAHVRAERGPHDSLGQRGRLLCGPR